ncbi:MAG TPA: cytochrome c [Vicinamibacterales bacterium]|jgi:mono/diheme cytochrome c family protein
MKLTVAIGCLFTIGVAVLSAGQSSRQGAPPRLVIESMTGEDSFMFYCAPCHGLSGRGEGPVAGSLKTLPPDLTALAKRNGGTFPRTDVISFVTGVSDRLPTHGPSDMPVWGPIFRALDPSDARVKIRIENIVAFIESIQIK